MRYLITGARGFIGAATVHAVLEAGHDVAAVVRPGALLGRLRDVAKDVTFIHAQLGAFETASVRTAFAAFKPDTVVHAGWEGVAGIERNADWQIARNVPPALHLVALAAESGAQHFIGLGSQAEYGLCSGRVSEAQPLLPTTLYGAAKVSTDVVTRCAAAIHNIRHTWLRIFSTYGPGSEPTWVLPLAANAMARGTAPEFTLCEQRWEFLHVRDAAAAVLAVAASGATGPFNLGSGDARPLREVMLGLRDRIDPGIRLRFGAVPYRADQVMHLEADISRLSTATGWTPAIALEAGLDELAAAALRDSVSADV